MRKFSIAAMFQRPFASCLLAFVVGLGSCGHPTSQPSESAVDTTSVNFEGEFAAQSEGSWFLVCATGRRYRVTGRALPELVHQHATLARAGDPVKAWVTGWRGLASAAPGLPEDSMLFVTQVLHLKAGDHCPPIPNADHSGRYEVTLDGANGRKRDVIIDLFTSGDALLSVDLHDGGAVLEEDGTWGVNSRGQVETIWTSRDQHQHFRFAENKLVSDPGPFAPATILLDRTQREAPRLSGTFGEVAEILQRHGPPPPPEIHLRTTALTELLPDSASRTAFLQEVITHVPIRSEPALQEMDLVTTFGDVVRVVRFERRRRS